MVFLLKLHHYQSPKYFLSVLKRTDMQVKSHAGDDSRQQAAEE